jgi:hypothetical protein
MALLNTFCFCHYQSQDRVADRALSGTQVKFFWVSTARSALAYLVECQRVNGEGLCKAMSGVQDTVAHLREDFGTVVLKTLRTGG